MEQKEMSKYLKLITAGVAIFLLIFVVWFLPVILEDNLIKASSEIIYWGICIFIDITAIPCFLCLAHFWKICGKIGMDQSFSMENAVSLKKMSHLMILDAIAYVIFLVWFCLVPWREPVVGLLFAILLAIFICVTLAVLCIALSHLVYKASVIQKEQELTI